MGSAADRRRYQSIADNLVYDVGFGHALNVKKKRGRPVLAHSRLLGVDILKAY